MYSYNTYLRYYNYNLNNFIFENFILSDTLF